MLLHGFPQDWYEWRRVMPRLAERFTVLAVDLPGVGGSDPLPDGYAAADLARAVHGLVRRLGLGPAHVVGHDVGGTVAYAYAREFPADTRTVTVLEVPVPGIPFPVDAVAASLWHVGFHMTPDLPEALVAGRERTYLRHFFDRWTARAVIDDDDVEHYAAAHDTPARLHAAFEFFRAAPANAAHTAAHTERLDVPLLLVGGEHLFGPVMPLIAAVLRSDHGWSDVEVRVVAGAMHYLVEEAPAAVVDLVERHAVGR